MGRHYYRRYGRYHRGHRRSFFNSSARTGWRVARFGGRTAGKVGFGVLKFGTKAASHILVAGVSIAGRIIRTISRS